MNRYPLRRLHTWLTGSALALCLVLCAACGGTDLPVATLPAPIGSPAGLVTTPAPLPTRTYSPEDLAARATKEANLQAEQNRKATRAAISPAPMHTDLPTYPPHPTEVRPFGIDTFEGCGGGEGNHDPLQMRNCWHGFLDGEYSAVIAGYAAATPEPGQEARGGLYILTSINDTTEYTSSPIYWTPTRAGAVQIIAVDGTRFTLRTYKGTLFVFDAATRQWVDPASAPEPSIVPTPTLTRPQWDATKVAILDGTEHDRQTRVASSTPFASTPIPLTQVMPVTTPPMGLSGGCADPSSTIIFSNCWNGKRNDEYIFAAALVKKSDPTQGILRVYTTTVGISQFGPVGWYTTPTRNGLIEIVDATNYQLTLRAEDNSIFTFDVLTRQWVMPAPSLLTTP